VNDLTPLFTQTPALLRRLGRVAGMLDRKLTHLEYVLTAA
jgi:hypothetical protein